MDLKTLAPLVLMFVTAIVILGIGSNVLQTLEDDGSPWLDGTMFQNMSFTPKAVGVSAGLYTISDCYYAGANEANCYVDNTTCQVYNSSNGFKVPQTNWSVRWYGSAGTSAFVAIYMRDSIYNTSKKNLTCPYQYRAPTYQFNTT